MVITRYPVYTTLSGSTQCIRICVWFQRHVFKHIALFSALLSSRESIYTEKRANKDSSDCQFRFVENRGSIFQ